MTRKVLVVLALLTVALCYGAPAMADNIHLCDINQLTSCNAGNAIPVYGSLPTQAWVFGTANTGDKLYIAVLTPQSGGSGTFNGVVTSTNLWTALGFGSPGPQNFPNFSSTWSQEQLATGITPGSFNVSSILGITWTGSVTLGQSVTLPGGYPVGTIFIAYLVDSNHNLVAVSPWSSCLIFVPEPSSLMLAGVGLLALGVFFSRRFLTN